MKAVSAGGWVGGESRAARKRERGPWERIEGRRGSSLWRIPAANAYIPRAALHVVEQLVQRVEMVVASVAEEGKGKQCLQALAGVGHFD